MRIVVVSVDAGGSEILAAWIARVRDSHHFSFYLEASAPKVFERRLGAKADFSSMEELDSALQSKVFDLLLTSLSWSSRSEPKAWVMARAAGVRSRAFTEGWGDYIAPLFIVDEKQVWPDELWVTEEYTYENMLRLGAAKEILKIEPNYYLKNIVAEIREKSLSRLSEQNLLYLCESMAANEKAIISDPQKGSHLRRGYDEFDALKYFFELVKQNRFGPVASIRIRTHPSEAENKYDEVLKQYSNLPIERSSKSRSLEEDLAWASTAAGCESIALAIAAMAGKKSYSCIPPQALIACRLPYREVLRI